MKNIKSACLAAVLSTLSVASVSAQTLPPLPTGSGDTNSPPPITPIPTNTVTLSLNWDYLPGANFSEFKVFSSTNLQNWAQCPSGASNSLTVTASAPVQFFSVQAYDINGNLIIADLHLTIAVKPSP